MTLLKNVLCSFAWPKTMGSDVNIYEKLHAIYCKVSLLVPNLEELCVGPSWTRMVHSPNHQRFWLLQSTITISNWALESLLLVVNINPNGSFRLVVGHHTLLTNSFLQDDRLRVARPTFGHQDDTWPTVLCSHPLTLARMILTKGIPRLFVASGMAPNLRVSF